MKSVVITGVSTGIGYDAARLLVERGFQVFGSVRQEADGRRLRQALGERFTPLLFDVTDEAAIKTAVSQVETALSGRGLSGLVNNAGVARPGPLMHVDLDEVRRQFEVNVVGLLAVTQAFLPLLGACANPGHPPGRVVNISSVSGRVAYPFLGLYAASKHALEALSDALRRELLIYGIEVVVVEPGSIVTPIWDKAAEEDTSQYADTDYAAILRPFQASMVKRGQSGLPVERVSEIIHAALTTERPKTRYVVVRNRLTSWLLPRFLPDRWFDRLVANRIGLQRVDW